MGQGELGGVIRRVVAARLVCERAMAGIGWATSHPECMDRLRKHYSQLAGGWFLARKAGWALRRCMTTDNADYCMLIIKRALSKSRVCLLRLEFDKGYSFGVKAWKEMEIWFFKGVFMLKFQVKKCTV